MKEDGWCFYYDNKIGCKVHSNKPIICRISSCRFIRKTEIKIEARFDTSNFQSEVIQKLSDNGFIEFKEKERASTTNFIVAGWKIKKPFEILIKLK